MYKDDEKIAEDCAVICSGPKATNNLAEYTAVIQALKWLNENGYNTEKIKICSDSQLCIHQLSGIYAVRSERILPLYRKTIKTAKNFKSIVFEWIPREKNKEADALSRKAYNSSLESDDSDNKASKNLSDDNNCKTRKDRALALVDGVGQLNQSIFSIPSSSGKKVYLVDLENISCECPDNQFRVRKCKHIMAAEMYISGKVSSGLAR